MDRSASSSPKVQVQDAVVVFLSLAARYFDCMCSTPKVSGRWFDRLRSGSGQVGAGRRQSSSEVGETTRRGTGSRQGPVAFCW